MRHFLLPFALLLSVSLAAQVPTYVPTDGLVAWYPFNGTANDESGNSHHGTIDGPLFGLDREGSASSSATFDGIDDGIFIPHHTDFESAEKTISFWMNPATEELLDTPSLADGMGVINKTNHTGSNLTNRYYAVTLGQGTMVTTPFSLTLATSTGNIVTNGSSVESTTAQDAINANEWQHVSAVQTSTELKLYLNGIQISSSSLLNPPLENDYDIKIGVDYKFNEYRYFNGSIDDISFHNRALTEEEIALMAGTTTTAAIPSYVSPNGLMGWYPFDGNTQDNSGNDHHGVAEGTTLTTDRFGDMESALHFNGIDDELDMPAFFNIGWQEFTISGWFSTDDFNKANQTIVNTNPHTGIGIGFNHPAALHHTVSLWLNSNPAAPTWDNSSAGHNPIIFADNDWHHVSLTKIGLNYVLKVDGNVVFETTVGITPVNYTCAIILGHIDVASGEYFKGTLDDFGFWNRALTEEELDALISGAGIQGCTNPAACNFNPDANMDDGSCIPSGCMEEGACNYNAAAECEGEACDYSCCPGPGCCGAGTHWDATLATCVVDVPDAVDAACTLMNLQELASGYAALVEQNAALDSLLSACEGDGSTNASGPCAGQDHVTYHGYDYAIVEIGDQCWFAENLRNEAFDDGTPIVLSNSDGDWTANASGPQRCAMNFSSSDADLYGYLYNFASVTSASGLCPSGFHVPTDSEFVTMEVFLGMPASESYNTQRRGESQGVGDKMKDDVLMTGNNSSGFTALPGGLKRATVNGFNYYQQDGYWWTSSSASTDNAWYRGLSNLHPATYRRDYPKGTGFSVRCVKD